MSGYTLFECLISALVASILFCISVPSIAYLSESSELETFSFCVMKEMLQTRNIAMNYSKNITACLSSENNKCNENNTFQLISFIDNNQDLQYQSESEQLFSINVNEQKNLIIHSNRVAYIFQPDGTVAGTPGTIRICSRYTHQGMEVITALSGRVRMQRVECPEES